MNTDNALYLFELICLGFWMYCVRYDERTKGDGGTSC